MTLAVCGLLRMAPLPSAAVRVTVQVYVPAVVSEAEATMMVKVAFPPLAIEAGPLILSQPLPPASNESVGVIVTFPEQLPVAPMVMVAVGIEGSKPIPALKLSVEGDGSRSVH